MSDIAVKPFHCLKALFAFWTTETDPNVEQAVFKSAGEAQQSPRWQRRRKCRWVAPSLSLIFNLNMSSAFKPVDSLFVFQHCDRTNPPSTPLTPMLWSGPSPLGRDFLSAGRPDRWPRDIQDRGPWWAQAQLCSRSPSAGVQASRELWEELWPHSSRDSQVGEQPSWVSIPPQYSDH